MFCVEITQFIKWLLNNVHSLVSFVLYIDKCDVINEMDNECYYKEGEEEDK